MPPRHPLVRTGRPVADRSAPSRQDTPSRARQVGSVATRLPTCAERPRGHRAANGAASSDPAHLEVTGGLCFVDPLGMLTGL
jgi:hypothetical protein